ncbi:MAG: hypothetical protein ABH950_01060 [Candidatus Altiarchaeota archaeon]
MDNRLVMLVAVIMISAFPAQGQETIYPASDGHCYDWNNPSDGSPDFCQTVTNYMVVGTYFNGGGPIRTLLEFPTNGYTSVDSAEFCVDHFLTLYNGANHDVFVDSYGGDGEISTDDFSEIGNQIGTFYNEENDSYGQYCIDVTDSYNEIAPQDYFGLILHWSEADEQEESENGNLPQHWYVHSTESSDKPSLTINGGVISTTSTSTTSTTSTSTTSSSTSSSTSTSSSSTSSTTSTPTTISTTSTSSSTSSSTTSSISTTTSTPSTTSTLPTTSTSIPTTTSTTSSSTSTITSTIPTTTSIPTTTTTLRDPSDDCEDECGIQGYSGGYCNEFSIWQSSCGAGDVSIGSHGTCSFGVLAQGITCCCKPAITTTTVTPDPMPHPPDKNTTTSISTSTSTTTSLNGPFPLPINPVDPDVNETTTTSIKSKSGGYLPPNLGKVVYVPPKTTTSTPSTVSTTPTTTNKVTTSIEKSPTTTTKKQEEKEKPKDLSGITGKATLNPSWGVKTGSVYITIVIVLFLGVSSIAALKK